MQKLVAALVILAILVSGGSVGYCKPTKPLDGVVVVLDPGHGEDGGKYLNPDCGAEAETEFGTAAEGVFTWEVAMRLKKELEKNGAIVVLTLKEPNGDYQPHSWGPKKFPCFPTTKKKVKGQQVLPFRSLIDIPNPAIDSEALSSRAATANRIYKQYSKTHDCYMVSIHFDSTSPDLCGMSFYHAKGAGTGFVDFLLAEMRAQKRTRIYDSCGKESVVIARNYSVLCNDNPDSYLVELGNIRSQKEILEVRKSKGKKPATVKKLVNPDLWRMRNPQNRQIYAELISNALVKYVRWKNEQEKKKK